MNATIVIRIAALVVSIVALCFSIITLRKELKNNA